MAEAPAQPGSLPRTGLARWLGTRPTADAATYRADIDGLRGIAIVAVVLYHAFPSALRSGYVGVDVFFVVSGYLITGIILGDLHRGRFTFGHFYARRIRRIFPALLVVLACTFLFSSLYMLGDEFRRLGKHVAGASAFLSNFVLWREAGYFDVASESKPLLHLWSLGIEEQFYLAWPLFLWLTWKRPRLQAALLALGVAVSFAANVHLIRGSPIGAFFLPVTRFWELLVGAMLATLPAAQVPAALRQPMTANALAVVAMAMIVASCFAIGDAASFPGWWALLPTAGAAFLIGGGSSSWIHRFVLRSQLLVWIGLISYPLYLWHWPLLTFSHLFGYQDPGVRGALAVASVILAYLTWRFVERPIRFGTGHPQAKIAGLCAALAAIGLVGALAWEGPIQSIGGRHLHAYTDDLAWTYSESPRFKDVEFGAGDFAGARKLKEDLASARSDELYLRWIPSGNPRKTLYAGDSHMEHYWSRIDQLILDNPGRARSAVFLTASGFLPVPGVQSDPVRRPYFQGLAATMVNYALSDPQIDTVVISSLWGAHLRDANSYDAADESMYYVVVDGKEAHLKRGRAANEIALASLADMIRTLKKAGKRVFLLQSVPGAPIRVTRDWGGLGLYAPPRLGKDFLPENAPLRERLFRLGEATGAEVIDPYPALCPDATCPAIYDGIHPVYMDGAHLADRYARRHASYIDRTLLD